MNTIALRSINSACVRSCPLKSAFLYSTVYSMPKITPPLTNTEVAKTKYNGKSYKLYDGKGLQLLITKNSKLWQFAYQRPVTKKANTIAIGNFNEVSLAQARNKRKEYRELLADGIDPAAHRDEQERQALSESRNTFNALADEWFARQSYDSPYTPELHLGYAKAEIGHKSITDITAYDVLQLCRIYEKQGKLTTANSVKVKVGQVMKYAIAEGLLKSNVVNDLAGALLSPVTTLEHHAAIIEPDEFGQLIRDIESFEHCHYIVKQALKLLALVFCRSVELRTMRIKDIDFKRNQWRYTPSKTRKSTAVSVIVPLSHQALAIIKDAIEFTGSDDLVFPSIHGNSKPMDRKTLSGALLNMGYKDKHVPHGFRASAKTILEDEFDYDPRFTEMQLGHVVKGSNGTAYGRGKFLRQRTEMMQFWSDWIDSLKAAKSP